MPLKTSLCCVIRGPLKFKSGKTCFHSALTLVVLPLTGPNYGGRPNFWLVNSENLHDITLIIYLNTGKVGWFVGGASGRPGSFDSLSESKVQLERE